MHKSYECTAVIDIGASFNFISQYVVSYIGWAVLMAEPVKVRFAYEERL